MKPMKLFKYEPACERKLQTLKNGEIWLSGANSFNDPFDCNIVHYDTELDNISPEQKKKILEIIYSQFDTSEPNFINNDLRNEIQSYYKSEIDDADQLERAIESRYRSIGVCSFISNGFDNLVMWAHYAKNHKGYCIEFEYENPLTISTGKSFQKKILPVTYVQSLPEIALMQLLIDPNKMVKDIILTKHNNWSYEKEYRLIDVKSSNEPLSISKARLKVTAIYVGLSADKKTESRLQEVAKALKVSLFYMSISEGQFVEKKYPR
jgi:hypothetical protein